MLGWMLFVTLLVFIFGVKNDFDRGFGLAFGWSSPNTPWTLIIIILVVGWVIYLTHTFHIVKFWFEK